MKRLNEKLWSVAKEYARIVGEVIDSEPDYWVAEDVSVSSCSFGDTWFLTLEEMQIIVDHMPKWVERYSSKKAVGQEVIDWMDWVANDGFDPDKNEWREHPRINLWSWLSGLRPEDIEASCSEEAMRKEVKDEDSLH